MKGTADEPQYAVGLLEGGVTLCDVIDNYIGEQTLVGVTVKEYYRVSKPCLTSLFSPQSEKNAFFVADLGVIMRQQVCWRTHLPQIRPYFPVRCNSSPTVIEVLAAFGTGFVCSNKVREHTPQIASIRIPTKTEKNICLVCLMLQKD